MTRDMDLVRELLISIEQLSPGTHLFDVPPGDADPAVAYEHVRLLINAGYVDGKAIGIMGTNVGQLLISGLTWEGHDFVEAVKNDTVWSKTKAAINAQGGNATVEIVKALATAFLKAQFGLP